MRLEEIRKDLELELSDKPKRLAHVYGVRDTALKIGKKLNLNLEILEITAFLHDITKYYSKKDNMKIIDSYFPDSQSIYDEYNDEILHSFSAYVVAKTKYDISEGEILNSILYHTVGRPEMSVYEKVIFISDYIEPNRTYTSCVKVREIAETSLDLAVFTAIDDSIKFYENLGSKIPLIAYKARQYYRPLGGKK